MKVFFFQFQIWWLWLRWN